MANKVGTKRRRIAVPLGLENVVSLSGGDTALIEDATATVVAAANADASLFDLSPLDLTGGDDQEERLPTFLVNALVGEKKKIAYDGCPFKYYVQLNQNAWRREGESEFLILRRSYEDLIRYVSDQMKPWNGSMIARVITGTAGIGKTMFALLLARLCFESNLMVLLYYENEFWAFTKNVNRGQTLDSLLINQVTVNETTIYYTSGSDEVGCENYEKLKQLLRLESIFIIRDCGKRDMQWLGTVVGRIVYFASPGQEAFLDIILNKIALPDFLKIKYAELWSAVECVWAIKLGLLPGFGDSPSDVEYILEAYRRFGGSLRNVLMYARALKHNKVASGALGTYPLSNYARTKMRTILNLHNADQKERAKAKSMVFHRTPIEGDGCFRIHFASTYLQNEFMKMEDLDKVGILNVAVAALSASSGKQSAYGTLYEEEFHRAMIEMPGSFSQTLNLLGTFDANAKKVKGYIPKPKPCLDFARSDVVHFPGKSLANARLGPVDDPLKVYFHPLTPNFPTHDSFVVCQASKLFEEDKRLTKQEKQQWGNILAKSVVLVGLQQTVSGSDNVEDKPSHTVVGQHLVCHLQDFKSILQQHNPHVRVLDEVVTVFVSPTETCRKMDLMPVLSKDGKPLVKAIPGFPGTAVQYYTVFEVDYIADLVKQKKDYADRPVLA